MTPKQSSARRSRVETQDFDEFVRRQQAEAPIESAVDWDEQRDQWLDHLNDLYAKIESLLRKYISSGQIHLEKRPIRLNEENIGSYTAEQMVLRIGRQEVNLVPVGTLLIGFKGRVDVEGPAAKAQIALVDSKASSAASLIHVSVGIGSKNLALKKAAEPIEWAWRIVTPPPERRFIEITQETLFQLIMEVANA
ncbi:MAG: hypothetical protein WA213_01365 [Terriglobales bacterium]